MSKAYFETLDRMEKDIAAVDVPAAAASLAISLRRIADAHERIAQVLQTFQPTEQSGWNSIPEALHGIMMNSRT